jgi:arabinogalactan endo-1,4-beta-galactosidase
MKSYKFSKDFAVGADISWLPQMLKSGFVFRDKHGQEQDLFLILKSYGIDTIRLRTWVNPSDDPHAGHCSAKETLDFALKCKEAGFRLMLNFHYSDSWADPGKQRIPAAWENLKFYNLVQRLYDYTHETMLLFKTNGVFLEWVQVGNETNPGMLLPMGSKENFDKLTILYNAGYDAIKAVSPDTKAMIHLAEINILDPIIKYFEELNRYGCRYDMMGFSIYPYFAKQYQNQSYDDCIKAFEQALKEIPERFVKDIMLAEIGGEDDKEDESFQLFSDVIKEISKQPKCKGIILWEPQGARVWSDYQLSSWRADGCPSKALDALYSIQK